MGHIVCVEHHNPHSILHSSSIYAPRGGKESSLTLTKFKLKFKSCIFSLSLAWSQVKLQESMSVAKYVTKLQYRLLEFYQEKLLIKMQLRKDELGSSEDKKIPLWESGQQIEHPCMIVCTWGMEKNGLQLCTRKLITSELVRFLQKMDDQIICPQITSYNQPEDSLHRL